jgi:hypothetical protein
VKVVVNAYVSVLIEGAAETMALADRVGIGHPQLAEVIEGGPLDAPIADAKLHKMNRRDYAPEFPLEWALKMRTWRSAPRVARTWRCWQRSGARGRGFRRGRRPVRYQTYR